MFGHHKDKETIEQIKEKKVHQEYIKDTKVVERPQEPIVERKIIPVEVETIKERPPVKEVLTTEQPINVTEDVQVTRTYGVPGCEKCGGTGMKKSFLTGKLKSCKRCKEKLKHMP